MFSCLRASAIAHEEHPSPTAVLETMPGGGRSGGWCGALLLAPGGELALEEAAKEEEEARHRALTADADGAIQILHKLESQPHLREYRALRAAVRQAKAVAFLTVQHMGLLLSYRSGTGFLIRRLSSCPSPGHSAWSAPSYFRCRGVGLGVMAGYEYTESVVCIHSDRDLERFARGEVNAGLEVTLLAGGDLLRDIASRPARIDSVPHDATLVFTVASGALASLSLNVGWCGAHRRMNQRLFGGRTLLGTCDVEPAQILGGQLRQRSPAAPSPPQPFPAPQEFRELYRMLDRLSMAWRK